MGRMSLERCMREGMPFQSGIFFSDLKTIGFFTFFGGFISAQMCDNKLNSVNFIFMWASTIGAYYCKMLSNTYTVSFIRLAWLMEKYILWKIKLQSMRHSGIMA